MAPSPILDAVYAKQKLPFPSAAESTTEFDAGRTSSKDSGNKPNADSEDMLLSQDDGKKMAEILDLPPLQVELERAIWQVEGAIKEQDAQEAEKSSAAPPSDEDNDPASQIEKKSQ